jgi:hypothetical protein
MKERIVCAISAAIFALVILLAPVASQAQQQSGAQEDNGIFTLGSVILSILHVPYKLVTCAATQASAATFYTTTYGVRGHYEGGTNGKDIGETARLSCMGDWIITPKQLKEDYGS